MTQIKNNMRAIHPSEILIEEFLTEEQRNPKALAKLLDIPPYKAVRILNYQASFIDFQLVKQLSLVFGTTEEFWLNLQQTYDVKMFYSDLETVGRGWYLAASVTLTELERECVGILRKYRGFLGRVSEKTDYLEDFERRMKVVGILSVRESSKLIFPKKLDYIVKNVFQK